MKSYPEQVEFAWLARDRLGQLAVFITAGDGPIPSSTLSAPDGLEGELLALPVTTQAGLAALSGNLSSFAALAERGLFAFDWTDIHRVESDEIEAYECVAWPDRALAMAALPLGLAEFVAVFDINFSETRTLDPRPLVDCVVSQRGR